VFGVKRGISIVSEVVGAISESIREGCTQELGSCKGEMSLAGFEVAKKRSERDV